jgi:hypothetical protein
MAKIVNQGAAPREEVKEEKKPDVRRVIVTVDAEGKAALEFQGEFNVLEMLNISDSLYHTALSNYRAYMEAQVFGLIQILKNKKIIDGGE